MKDKSVITRLKRYSTHAIGHALDEDFAEAVHDAAVLLDALMDDYEEALNTIESLKKSCQDCRNELCIKCGQYKLDCCGECRWKSGC